MASLSPFKFPYPRGLPKMDNFKKLLTGSSKKPPVGVTQGGSSRKDKGAKVAATNGLFRQNFKPPTGE